MHIYIYTYKQNQNSTTKIKYNRLIQGTKGTKNYVSVQLSYSVVSDSCDCSLSLQATPWTVACQAPLSMGFSRQEYWSGLPFPSPGDLSNPGIEPGSSASQSDSLPTELQGKPNAHLPGIKTKGFIYSQTLRQLT